MPLVLPNIGEVEMLECALRDTTPEALVLCLYSNNATLSEATVLANLTECAISGYAGKNLTRAGWGAAVAGDPSYIPYGTPQVFAFSGTGTVYGYFLKGATSGNLYWAEVLYPSGQLVNSGDSITVTPRFELS